MVFLVLYLTLLVARLDQGIIPAIAPNLKAYFGFNSTQIGSLGSCIYFGATVGKFLITLLT